MRLGRLALFLSAAALRGKLLPLAAVGALLVMRDVVKARIPALLTGFVLGGYSAALASLAVSNILAASGRFGEYAASRLGCRSYTLGLGLASALTSMAASLLSWATASLYASIAGRALFDKQSLLLALYSGAAMGYGYVLAAHIARTSLILFLALVLLARLLHGEEAMLLYAAPLLVALSGALLQTATCSLPLLYTRLLRGGELWRTRWRRQ